MPTKMNLCPGGGCNGFNVNDGKLNNIRSAIDIGDGKFRYQDDLYGDLPSGGSCSETPLECSGDSILSSTQALGGELFQCCPTHLPELVLGDSGNCQCVSPDGSVAPNRRWRWRLHTKSWEAHFLIWPSAKTSRSFHKTQQLPKDLWKMSPLMLR